MATPEELQQLLKERLDRLKTKIRSHAEFCEIIVDQMDEGWDTSDDVAYLYTEVLELATDMENLKMESQQLQTMSRTLMRLEMD